MMVLDCGIVPATLALRLPEARVQQSIIVLPTTEDVPIIVFTMVLVSLTARATLATHHLERLAQRLTTALRAMAAAVRTATMGGLASHTAHATLAMLHPGPRAQQSTTALRATEAVHSFAHTPVQALRHAHAIQAMHHQVLRVLLLTTV